MIKTTFAAQAPQPSSITTTPITFAGSSTLLPVIEQLTPFLSSPSNSPHQRYRIAVQGGGSSMGIKSVQLGMADIGMVSRELSAKEQQRFHSLSLAYDLIALIVHRDNTISNITSSEVRSIYSGQQRFWPHSTDPINIISKEHGRATRAVFDRTFDLKGRLSRKALFIGANGQAIITVSNDPNAIAYVAYSAAKAAIEIDAAHIKIVRLDNKVPDPKNALAQGYPLLRPLNLIWHPQTEPKITSLLKQIVHPHLKARIESMHLMPSTTTTSSSAHNTHHALIGVENDIEKGAQ